MTNIPTPESVTAGWLTECLRQAGHKTATVTDFTSTQIGTGQIGKCVRFELNLSGNDQNVPISLVGKFPSDDPTSQSAGMSLRNYYREVQFYRTVAPSLTISVPKCYYAEIVDEGPRFALLLEDLRPAEQGDQMAGCTPEITRAAVLELVGLQAPTWCDASLARYDWLQEPTEGLTANLQALYAQCLPGFLDRFGSSLTPDQAGIISRVAESTACPMYAPVGEFFCLEHVDYRLDNLMIDNAPTPPKVTAVDWQSVKIGKPLNDVAYFMGAGLLREVRRPVEKDIVREYHQAMERAGVTDLGWEQCWTEYRRGTFSGFAVTVIASLLVQQTERGDQMFTTMARRHSQHALDLGADEFL